MADTVYTMETYLKQCADPEMILDLSFWVPLVSSTIVVGSMGAGKTSLMNALVGQLPASRGISVIEDDPRIVAPTNYGVSYFTLTPLASDHGINTDVLVANSFENNDHYRVLDECRTKFALESLLGASMVSSCSLLSIRAGGVFEALGWMCSTLNQDGSMRFICESVDLVVVVGDADGVNRILSVWCIPNIMGATNELYLSPKLLWEFASDGSQGYYKKIGELPDDIKTRNNIDDKNRLTLEDVINHSNGIW